MAPSYNTRASCWRHKANACLSCLMSTNDILRLLFMFYYWRKYVNTTASVPTVVALNHFDVKRIGWYLNLEGVPFIKLSTWLHRTTLGQVVGGRRPTLVFHIWYMLGVVFIGQAKNDEHEECNSPSYTIQWCNHITFSKFSKMGFCFRGGSVSRWPCRYLYGNALTGSIPDTLGSLTGLSSL